MPPKVNHAELLQRCGKTEEATEAWKRLGAEARRRGNSSDQAVFNEKALRLDEEDQGCLEGAAEARIALGEPKEALVHIQKAYAANPNSEQVLSMLAQCFELMDQQPKAKKVLLQLAKLFGERNEPVGRRDALQRAYVCDEDDAELKALVGAAVARAERCEMRLTDHKWSEPADEAQGAIVVEASVLAKYGFADRAKDVIEAAAAEVRGSLPVRARLVEVLVQLEDNEAALEELGSIEVDAAGDAGVLDAVRTRAGALKGEFDSPEGSVLAEEPEVEEEVVELDIEDEDGEDEAPALGDDVDMEAQGDALVAAGDSAGAMAAYQKALAADPTNEEVLMKLGELVAGGDDEEDDVEDEPTPVDLPHDALSPVDEGGDMPDFQSIFKSGQGASSSSPSAPTTPAAPAPVVSGGDSVETARAHLLMGQYDEAIALLSASGDLNSAVLCAQARMHSGDPAGARKTLRRALDDSSDTDAAAAEALWWLARLQAVTGKAKAAVRTLDDLEDLDSGHRSVEVVALRRGIELLKGR